MPPASPLFSVLNLSPDSELLITRRVDLQIIALKEYHHIVLGQRFNLFCFRFLVN